MYTFCETGKVLRNRGVFGYKLRFWVFAECLCYRSNSWGYDSVLVFVNVNWCENSWTTTSEVGEFTAKSSSCLLTGILGRCALTSELQIASYTVWDEWWILQSFPNLYIVAGQHKVGHPFWNIRKPPEYSSKYRQPQADFMLCNLINGCCNFS